MQTRSSRRNQNDSEDFIVLNDYFTKNDNKYQAEQQEYEEKQAEQQEDEDEDEQQIEEENEDEEEEQQENDEDEDQEEDEDEDQDEEQQEEDEEEQDEQEDENITIEKCLDNYYDENLFISSTINNIIDDNTESNNKEIFIDYETALNHHSTKATKYICNGLFDCFKQSVIKCSLLIKYPLLFAFIIVISSLLICYSTYNIIDYSYSVGFITNCDYFPEENRCLFNTPLSLVSVFEHHRNFVRKNTYLRITNNTLEYWNPWLYKKVEKLDNCENNICHIKNLINQKQVLIVNNELMSIRNIDKYDIIDKYSDINQVTIINENKWISIQEIEPVVLKSLTEKMFQLKEGISQIDKTTYNTKTVYTYLYSLFSLTVVGIWIFIN